MSRRGWLPVALLLAPLALGWPVLRDVLWLPTAGRFQLSPSLERRYLERARAELAAGPDAERTLGLVECLPLEESLEALEKAVARFPDDLPLRAALIGRCLSLGVPAHRELLVEQTEIGRKLAPDNAYFCYLRGWVEAVPTVAEAERTRANVGPGLSRALTWVERGNQRPRYDSYRTRSRKALRRVLRSFGMPSLEARIGAAAALHRPELVDLTRLATVLDAYARDLERRGRVDRARRIWQALAWLGRKLDTHEQYLFARGMAHHVLGNALQQLARLSPPAEAAKLADERKQLVWLSQRWRRNLSERPDFVKSPAARAVILSYTTLGVPLLLGLLAAMLLVVTLRSGRCEHPLSRSERLRILLAAVVLPALAQLIYLLFFTQLRLSSGRQLLYLQLLNFAWAWVGLLLLFVLTRARVGKGGRWGRISLLLLLGVAGALLLFQYGVSYSTARLRQLYLVQAVTVALVVVLVYLHTAHPGDSQPLLLLRHQRSLWSATLVICLLLFYICVGVIHLRRQRLESQIEWYQHNPGGYLVGEKVGG